MLTSTMYMPAHPLPYFVQLSQRPSWLYFSSCSSTLRLEGPCQSGPHTDKVENFGEGLKNDFDWLTSRRLEGLWPRLQALISCLKEDRIDSLLNEKQERGRESKERFILIFMLFFTRVSILIWRRFSCSSSPRLEGSGTDENLVVEGLFRPRLEGPCQTWFGDVFHDHLAQD